MIKAFCLSCFDKGPCLPWNDERPLPSWNVKGHCSMGWDLRCAMHTACGIIRFLGRFMSPFLGIFEPCWQWIKFGAFCELEAAFVGMNIRCRKQKRTFFYLHTPVNLAQTEVELCVIVKCTYIQLSGFNWNCICTVFIVAMAMRILNISLCVLLCSNRST